MNQNSMPGLDLSGLPPEIRARIEKRFASLSPEARAKWASGGAPLLARLVNGLAAAGQAKAAPPPLPESRSGDEASEPRTARYEPSVATHPTRTEPHGHYNDTVRPGDAPGSSAWILIVALALGIAAVLLF